jgi:hypothetical protein
VSCQLAGSFGCFKKGTQPRCSGSIRVVPRSANPTGALTGGFSQRWGTFVKGLLNCV